MYLKQVTIHGFKTFANKVTIDFGRGVTSVIGPNGCGKSNIIDSIRWVLGEQSAKSMRGGEMTDIISNGNKKKKPSAFCEVTIVLDNSDNSLSIDKAEVSIRRKLSRSGDAEYFLNEEPARLKDIRELFMDTGIGAKTNTVIEQEQLTKLLQASSKERKMMIEEAAGISRFRQRRQESHLKLSRVNDNVTRLQDIISEVEKQKRSISTQASKATRFESMQKEMRRLKFDVAIMELHGWINQRMDFEKNRTEFKTAVEQMQNNEKDTQEEMVELEEKELNIEATMAKLQGEQAAFFQEYASVENSIKENRNKIETLTQDISTLEIECKQLSEELEHAESKQNTQGESTEESVDIEEINKEINSLKEEVSKIETVVKQGKEALAASQNWEIQLIQKKSQFQNDIIKIESHMEFLNRRLKQVIDKEVELKDKSTELDQSIDPKLVEAQEEANEQLKNKEELINKTISIRSKLKELELELRKSAGQTAGTRSRLALLKEMEEKYEGIGAGVRNILDIYVKKFPDEMNPGGVHGVVADLITVPEEYIEAIESALGGRSQNIVFSTAEQAKQAIMFLRRENYGRATLLPIDRVRPRNKLQGAVLNYPGVKGDAFNLVGFDPSYHNVFSNLLHGTLIVDTMDHALAISKDHRVRIVTLDGDLISPEGSMSGGGKSKDSGILSRKHEIEELDHDLIKNESDQKGRMSEHESLLNKEARTERNIQLIDAQLKEKDDLLKMADQKKAVAEREVIRIKQERIINSREKETLVEQIENSQKELDTKNTEKEELAQTPEGEKLIFSQEQLEQDEENLNRLKAVLQERELKKVSIMERSQSAFKEKEYLTEKITELKERIARRQEILKERLLQKTQSEELLAVAEEQFKGLESQKESEQSTFFKLKEEREVLRARRSELQKLALETTDKIRTTDRELNEIAVKEERLRVKQEELFHRMHSEFHTNIEDVYYSRRESGDELFHSEAEFEKIIKESNETIIELDNKLSNLGNVNFEAVAELKSLQEREGDLKSQMTDLDQSFKKLDDFIKDLDQKCNEMFKDTFDKVNEHFVIMFKRLFGGGEGKLIIEKDVDPLLAGITISATPPGKSPKILSQLSGGEKVLTTIAFLFSIFLYKPSPFCILDEIDAPLDEHNVDRFMEAIRSFTDRCQFLIVTHNRRTMSLSDVIHGVTMQETGVSTCMSVDINSLEFEK